MKILTIIAALMMVAGLVFSDVVLGVCGLVSLANGSSYLLAKRFTVNPARA